MKVVVLAAGKGTRMQPLTNNMPKVMIPVKNRPFIEYVIQNIQKAGFSDIALVVGYKKEKIKEHLGNKVEYIAQEEQKGTAHAVSLLEGYDDNFLVTMGDNIFSPQDIRAIAKNDNFSYVGCCKTNKPEQFGVVETDRDKVGKIIEKPTNPVTNLINTALYKFTPDIFNAIKKIKPSERGELEVTDAINVLAAQKKVKYYELQNYMINFGCREDMPVVESQLKELGL